MLSIKVWWNEYPTLKDSLVLVFYCSSNLFHRRFRKNTAIPPHPPLLYDILDLHHFIQCTSEHFHTEPNPDVCQCRICGRQMAWYHHRTCSIKSFTPCARLRFLEWVRAGDLADNAPGMHLNHWAFSVLCVFVFWIYCYYGMGVMCLFCFYIVVLLGWIFLNFIPNEKEINP